MKGYDFSLSFNESYAFREYPELTEYQKIHQEIIPDISAVPRSNVRRCETCGELLDKWNEPLIGLKIKKRKYDISCTYDGITIVSHHFKEVYDSNNLSGLKFIPLPDDPDFYQIQAAEIVQFDAERRGTRFIKQCPICEKFESVVGATPIYFKEGSVIPELGFVRTDIEFASNDEKHPMILCGPGAGKILEASKLKGLDLVEF